MRANPMPVVISRDYELSVQITQSRHVEGQTSRTPGPVDAREYYVLSRAGYVLD